VPKPETIMSMKQPTRDTAGGYSLAFSHIGLFANDVGVMQSFYVDVLGFFITDEGTLKDKRILFLSRNPREHHQIVLVEGKPQDTLLNINQVSFRVRSLDELKTFYDRIVSYGARGLEPVIHGNSWSIYFRDPEDNRIEVFADTDWYISQPFKEPLDFSLSSDEIRAYTAEYARRQPGYKPLAEWHQEMADKMGVDLALS